MHVTLGAGGSPKSTCTGASHPADPPAPVKPHVAMTWACAYPCLAKANSESRIEASFNVAPSHNRTTVSLPHLSPSFPAPTFPNPYRHTQR